MSLAENAVQGAGVGSVLGPIGTVVGSALGAGASLLGDVFQEQSSAANVQQQEQYQTEMADTQYQRTVSDMKAAGLNPLAMFSGGGGMDAAPGGSVAQPGQYSNVGAGAVAGMNTADTVQQEQASLASQQLGLRQQEADIAQKNAAAIVALQGLGAVNNGEISRSQSAAAQAVTDSISASQDSSLYSAQESMGKTYWLGKALSGTPIPGAIGSAVSAGVGVLGQGLSAGGFNAAADMAAATGL